LCQLLISSKADVKAEVTSDYAFKGTPLHSAADGWNADVCALLLDANADVNTVGSSGRVTRPCVQMSLPICNILSFIGNRDIDTPLLQACKGWHVVTEEEEENGLDYFIDLFPSRSRGFASTKKKGDRMQQYWQFMQSRVNDVCRCLIAANADVNARDYK
jgi:hypothetical protein